MHTMKQDTVKFLVADVGEKRFIFIALMKDGEAFVKQHGEGVYTIKRLDLQQACKCEDIRFVAGPHLTRIVEGIFTIGLEEPAVRTDSIGDLGHTHYCLIRQTDESEIGQTIERYLESIIVDAESEQEDYSLLSEPQFMEFKRIDDEGSIGIAAMEHPEYPDRIALGIVVSDRSLADIDEVGFAMVDVSDMAEYFGNEFTKVIITKNVKHARIQAENTESTCVIALPKRFSLHPHSEIHYSTIGNRTFALLRVRHSTDIKQRFSPESN